MFQGFYVASQNSCPAFKVLVFCLVHSISGEQGALALGPATNYGVRDDRRGLITADAARNILSLSRLMMLDPRRGESSARRFIKRRNVPGLTWLLTSLPVELRNIFSANQNHRGLVSVKHERRNVRLSYQPVSLHRGRRRRKTDS